MDLQFIRKAERLAELRKWEVLGKICKEQLQLVPDDIYAIYFLALSYQGRGDLKTAKDMVKSILSKESSNTDFKGLYADILLQEKSYRKAADIIKELLAVQPNNEFNLAQMSKAKLGLLQFEEAIKMAKMALAINPTNEVATNVLLLASEFHGKPDPDQLKNISKVNPNNPLALSKNIKELLDKKQYSLAGDLALSALSRSPNDRFLKREVEETIGMQYPFVRFFKKIDEQARDLIVKQAGYSNYTLYAIFWILMFMGKGFESVNFLYSGIGYFIFLSISFFTFYNPINKCFVVNHSMGKRLFSSIEKNWIHFIQLSMLGGVGCGFLGFYFQEQNYLVWSILLFTNTVPISIIIDSETGPKKWLTVCYVFNLLLTILFFKMNLVTGILISAYLNCLFIVLFPAFYALKVLNEKYK